MFCDAICMTVAQLVLRYIQALIWPGIAAIGLIAFRSRIAGIFGRIKSASIGSASVAFDTEADSAKILLERAQHTATGVDTEAEARESIAATSAPVSRTDLRKLPIITAMTAKEYIQERSRLLHPSHTEVIRHFTEQFSFWELPQPPDLSHYYRATAPQGAVYGAWSDLEAYIDHIVWVSESPGYTCGEQLRNMHTRFSLSKKWDAIADAYDGIERVFEAFAESAIDNQTWDAAARFIDLGRRLIQLVSHLFGIVTQIATTSDRKITLLPDLDGIELSESD